MIFLMTIQNSTNYNIYKNVQTCFNFKFIIACRPGHAMRRHAQHDVDRCSLPSIPVLLAEEAIWDGTWGTLDAVGKRHVMSRRCMHWLSAKPPARWTSVVQELPDKLYCLNNHLDTRNPTSKCENGKRSERRVNTQAKFLFYCLRERIRSKPVLHVGQMKRATQKSLRKHMPSDCLTDIPCGCWYGRKSCVGAPGAQQLCQCMEDQIKVY